jgi:hypothetical protein
MIKNLLAIIMVSMVIGGVITYLALLAAEQRQWYDIQQIVEKQQVILIDSQAEDTVTILDFRGGKVKVTREP